MIYNQYCWFVNRTNGYIFLDKLKGQMGIGNNNFKKENILKVDKNDKWQCCKCDWIGTHDESGNKTILTNGLWLLVCPVCNGKEFYKSENN